VVEGDARVDRAPRHVHVPRVVAALWHHRPSEVRVEDAHGRNLGVIGADGVGEERIRARRPRAVDLEEWARVGDVRQRRLAVRRERVHDVLHPRRAALREGGDEDVAPFQRQRGALFDRRGRRDREEGEGLLVVGHSFLRGSRRATREEGAAAECARPRSRPTREVWRRGTLPKLETQQNDHHITSPHDAHDSSAPSRAAPEPHSTPIPPPSRRVGLPPLTSPREGRIRTVNAD